MVWALLAGLSTVLAVLALALLLFWQAGAQRHRAVRRRLSTDLAAARTDARHRAWWQLFSAPGRQVDAWFDEDGETDRLLVQAGWRSAIERAGYYAAQALLPLLTVVLVFTGAVFGDWSGVGGFVYGLGLICASLLAPRFLLRRAARARRNRIRNEVAMFIHLLALLFDAGLSLRQALVSLVREGEQVLPVLGEEVKVVLRQLEAGADPAEALHTMGRSLDVAELTAVLGVLRQVDRYGGELREPLMEALSVVEERRQLALRETVNGLSGRMTVVMVLFFFPALLIFVAGPAFLSVIQALAGSG